MVAGGGVVSRAAWSALASGAAMVGGSIAVGLNAHIGWHPTDPAALSGAAVVGAVLGVAVVARIADGIDRVDRCVGRHRDPECLDLGGVLRLSPGDDLTALMDAVREDGAR